MKNQLNPTLNPAIREATFVNMIAKRPVFLTLNVLAASARDQVTLVAQADIQPCRIQGTRKFNDCQDYQHPFPTAVLEQRGNKLIDLMVTWSYSPPPAGCLMAE